MSVELIDLGKPVEYLPVDPKKMPYSFRVKLNDRTYQFAFRYNQAGGFFTADLLTSSGEVLAYGEIVRYGRPLFGSIEDERFPLPVIIPKCLEGSREQVVTYENLGRDVRLYLHNRRG